MTAAKGFIASPIQDRYLALASLLLFKLSWVLLILFHNQALLPVVLIQLVCVVINPCFSRNFPRIILIATAGFVLEQGAVVAGVFSPAASGPLFWLALLWFAFVLALTHGLAFLGRLSLLVQMLAGAVTAPLVYSAASGLGALHFGMPSPVSLLVLAAGWTLFLPLALKLLCVNDRQLRSTAQRLVLLCVALFAARVDAASLIGQGTLRFMWMPVYEARLYGESATCVYLPRCPLKLELIYKRAFSADTIIGETLRQWDARHVAVRHNWMEILNELMPDVEKGDALSLVVDADLNAKLFHNGNLVGESEDYELLAAFVGIWLAPDTTNPELRKQLLGVE